MKIHNHISRTSVNGPGERFALWVQGCSRNCCGCFNPQTHDMKNGIEVSVDEIIKLIPQKISGITISGGEPFDQAEELEELLRHASKRKLHRLVYTGYRYEELAASKIASVNQSLALTDMLVDGAYDYRIQPTHSLSGSGNQRMLQLKEGNIIKEIEATESVFHNGELIIDRNGNITATGFFDSMMRMQHEY